MKNFLISLVLLLPSISLSAPVKQPEKQVDYTLDLVDIRFVDLARLVYGDILKKSYTFDKDLIEATDTVSVNGRRLKPEQVESLMVDLSKNRGFIHEIKHGVLYLARRKTDLEKADQEILIYLPKYRSTRYLTDIVTSLTDARSLSAHGVKNPLSQATQKNQAQIPPTSATAKLDLASADQIALLVDRADLAKVKKLLADLDTQQGEVVLKAAVYEVGSTQAEGGAVKAVANLLKGKLKGSIGGGLPGADAVGVAVGGLDLVLAMLDQDSRFKTISRPMVRVRSGAQARFSVGQDVPVLGQATLDKNGNPVQAVEYKQSGVILTVTPDIRESVVDLDISQELSSFVATTTGVNGSPTLLKRTVNSKLSIKSGEVVIFAGLNESKMDESESRFFGWLLGQRSNQGDSEILVFVEAQRI